MIEEKKKISLCFRVSVGKLQYSAVHKCKGTVSLEVGDLSERVGSLEITLT
jgi:hypothetical protein